MEIESAKARLSNQLGNRTRSLCAAGVGSRVTSYNSTIWQPVSSKPNGNLDFSSSLTKDRGKGVKVFRSWKGVFYPGYPGNPWLNALLVWPRMTLMARIDSSFRFEIPPDTCTAVDELERAPVGDDGCPIDWGVKWGARVTSYNSTIWQPVSSKPNGNLDFLRR